MFFKKERKKRKEKKDRSLYLFSLNPLKKFVMTVPEP